MIPRQRTGYTEVWRSCVHTSLRKMVPPAFMLIAVLLRAVTMSGGNRGQRKRSSAATAPPGRVGHESWLD